VNNKKKTPAKRMNWFHPVLFSKIYGTVKSLRSFRGAVTFLKTFDDPIFKALDESTVSEH
jgi:hypothetical protein